ncbi:MAG TPA: FGGY family carbohydrate kinase [Anaerohalosphaeraceae bacterium]|jgi:xylulokinase|nr:FGGY family carbohydrate kinase [Anaerohalosphaeraceae bacterium]HRT49936.1 FGGY family carbohydrate kinase [Anaerohalosphaeraceae bacterium]HRT85766.1 FGGY family carbohydrate kinase [Anaerohalosphaeraceae bacterium]
MYLLGYDIGTSSIKATLMDAATQQVAATATCPKKEMEILAPQSGWAEQHPESWWQNVKAATAEILAVAKVAPVDVAAIGITYQMHGLVCVDKNKNVLRPSIIWCDSRAVGVGRSAAEKIGPDKCLAHLLNYPGNFTAAKLGWVKQNEPDVYRQIHKIMLPGDYIAMKMTDRIVTTVSGLSEGILWDFKDAKVADLVLDAFGISPDLLAPTVDTFANQGELTSAAAAELGLKAGTPIAYRAGDQPNNAFSLNVLNPGEIAATAGTSGVVYGIGDQPNYDPKSRVNTFIHVNNTPKTPRNGVLLCLNGTGILNSWLKHNVAAPGEDYPQMNDAAAKVPVGSAGLAILPFGNGAERILENENIGASIHNLNFNVHTRAHVFRAAQEGIVFALNYGLDIMRNMGIVVDTVRAGSANMFLSPIFASAFATTTGARVELYNTDGSQGAARGAGIGAGIYKDYPAAFAGLKRTRTIDPDPAQAGAYKAAYATWLKTLESQL